MNTVIITCSRCHLSIKRVNVSNGSHTYECKKCSHNDYKECPSCDVIAKVFKLRGEGSLEERNETMLYQCQHCKVEKCDKCIGNIQHWGDVRSAVPKNVWLEFYSRRFLSLHSCCQTCHDAYVELD